MKKISKRNKKIQKQSNSLLSKKTLLLIFIVILTIAIPITVLALQQVQNIRPEAAAVPSIPDSQICDGESNAFGAVASPQPVTEGQEITFRLTDETDSVDVEKNTFGNGVISSSCKQNGSAVTCIAKGNFKNGEKTSNSTWVYKAVTGDKQLCKYTVEDDVSGTRPTSTPKPSPTPRTQAACNGKLETVCTVDNKPRLLISYDLRGGIDGSCDVSLEDVSGGDKKTSLTSRCTNRSQFALDTLDGQALKNGTQYKLVVKNGNTCADYSVKGQVTTNCNGETVKNPTPTPRSGNGFGTPESVEANCNEGTQDDPKITITWHKVTGAVSYVVKLMSAQNGSVVKEQSTDKTTLTIDGIEKDKTYWYTVTAVDNTNKKSSPTSNTRNIKCTNENLKRTDVISAIANTFQELMSNF